MIYNQIMRTMAITTFKRIPMTVHLYNLPNAASLLTPMCADLLKRIIVMSPMIGMIKERMQQK